MLISAIALAGGGGRSGAGSCGVFSGGLMALSAAFCPRSEKLSDADLARLQMVRPVFSDFRDWFIQEFGGVNCVSVLQKLFGYPYNLNDEKEHNELKRVQNELGISCNLVVEKVAVRAVEMLS